MAQPHKKVEKQVAIKPLVFEKVSVGYGGVPVAENVDIVLKPETIHGLIGLNGVGKTTLIKAALGLRESLSGSIQVFGKHAGDLSAKKQLSYLPERFDPPWFLSGLEFVKFSGKLYGYTPERKEIYDLAEKLSLDTSFLPKKAQSYSKGMRQKLGLIATLIMPAKLLILDEPMSGLDPLARVLVKDVIAESRERGKTIFLSSHILADLDELCDELSVLHDKKIQYSGTPDGLKKQTKQKTLERAFLKKIA